MSVTRLVDGVDHVYVPVADATAAHAVLADDLRLPVLWPVTDFGPFTSAGTSVGSIKLEVIEPAPEAPWSTPHQPPRLQGVALRPSAAVDADYLTEVDHRGIHRTSPARFDRDGRPAWTNVYFTDLIGDTAGAFVCDYHLPESRDLERRRQVLTECGGGRLGVVDAVELLIGTRDPDAAARRWQPLLGPPEPGGHLTWHPVVGPAIRLVAGQDERVDHLALAVRSVGAAERVWAAASGVLAGLPLRFVAAGAA